MLVPNADKGKRGSKVILRMSFMDVPTKGEEGEELFVVRRRIRGPLWWADAFCADRQGRYLSTHDDTTFGVGRGCKMRFGMSTSFDKNDTAPGLLESTALVDFYAVAQGCTGLGQVIAPSSPYPCE